MKLVKAVIKSFKLDDVLEALIELEMRGLTATDVRGFGRKNRHTEIYRGAEYKLNYVPNIKLESAIEDNLLDRALETISKAAQTGQIGDGKLFVSDLISAVRIRTGETGSEAL